MIKEAGQDSILFVNKSPGMPCATSTSMGKETICRYIWWLNLASMWICPKKNYSTPNPKILWSNNHFPYCHFGSIPIFQTHPCQSTWCHCALPTPHGHAGHATHLCRKCSLGCVGRLETSAWVSSKNGNTMEYLRLLRLPISRIRTSKHRATQPCA